MEAKYLQLLFVALGIYSFTLVYAHLLLARIDRRIKMERRPDGRINYSSVALGKLDLHDPEIRKALLFMRINQATIYLFFGVLALTIGQSLLTRMW